MKKKRGFLIAAGVFAGLANGFFGGGGGAIALLAFKMLPDTEPKQAHALCVAAMLPVSLISAGVYLLHGEVPGFTIILQTMLGTFLGGMIGAKLLPRVSDVWLGRIFAAFVVFSAIRMLG